jgi:hypothetical protein
MARAREAAGAYEGQREGAWIRKEVTIEKKRKQVEIDKATHFVQHSFPGGGI